MHRVLAITDRSDLESEKGSSNNQTKRAGVIPLARLDPPLPRDKSHSLLLAFFSPVSHFPARERIRVSFPAARDITDSTTLPPSLPPTLAVVPLQYLQNYTYNLEYVIEEGTMRSGPTRRAPSSLLLPSSLQGQARRFEREEASLSR